MGLREVVALIPCRIRSGPCRLSCLVMTYSAVAQSVTIEAPAEAVLSYVAKVSIWPAWAITEIDSVRLCNDGHWEVKTPFGDGVLKVRANAAVGTIDYHLLLSDQQWLVPGRVVPNGDGCIFSLLLMKHPQVRYQDFQTQVAGIERELARLKALFENQQSTDPVASEPTNPPSSP